ncbi:hypothetical protein [Nocardia sp. NPDC024068]|uniref:hypothetical protein n=1 Tax=Nocardia sp. NPDC024068 TaxID=3157197 RepID=UPI0033C32006
MTRSTTQAPPTERTVDTDPATGEPAADAALPDADTEMTAAEVDSAGPGRSGRRLRNRLLSGAVVVALVLTSGLSAILGWQWLDRRAIDGAAQAALAAAQQYAVTLTSIDAARIDADFAAIDAGATGEFKKMYAESAQNLRPLLVEARSVSKGRVTAASIRSASRDRVVIMLFVDAEVGNTTTAVPRIDRNRIIMTMYEVDGRWLAGEVELL